MKSAPLWPLLGAILACTAIAATLGARDLDLPGLYYDEVIQAEPALAFLRGDPLPSEIPGIRAARLLGRRLPWMTQPYMGALKSQALIPTFAILEPGAATLRGVTLVWAIAGLALAMIWANRALGFGVALLAGGLLCVDASFLYIARHDWGSFSLALLLRCAALLLLYEGQRVRSPTRLFGGGLCAGLGVYNKIDFAVWLVAAAAAACCVAPALLKSAFRERRRETAAAAAGLLLGAAPIAIAAGGALAAAGAASRAQAGVSNWSEKLAVATATLDGSYFQRLMLTGGSFESLPGVNEAISGPGLVVVVVCAIFLIALLGFERLRNAWESRSPAQAFAVLCLIFTFAGLLVTPRAVRIHHYLNAWPFPQLVVAIAFVELWHRAARLGSRMLSVRVAIAAVVIAVLAGNLRMAQATHETLRETGGRGRWSDAARTFVDGLPEATRVVCLDWGFAGPLRFSEPGRALSEPIWKLRRVRDPRVGVAIAGAPEDVYLFYEPEFAVFPYGAALLEAVGSLPADSVSVSLHNDREGRPVFRAIRFDRPHRLVFRGDRASVQLR